MVEMPKEGLGNETGYLNLFPFCMCIKRICMCIKRIWYNVTLFCVRHMNVFGLCLDIWASMWENDSYDALLRSGTTLFAQVETYRKHGMFVWHMRMRFFRCPIKISINWNLIALISQLSYN